MKKNFRSMRRYTIAVLVTAAACLASGCAKKEVSVEVVSGAENENKPQISINENKPQISIQENPAALFLKITAEYDSDWQDEHSLISTKTSQIRILDEDHAELQKALDALNQKNLDSQSMFMADNQADARQMYQDKPELMEDNGWESELTQADGLQLARRRTPQYLYYRNYLRYADRSRALSKRHRKRL